MTALPRRARRTLLDSQVTRIEAEAAATKLSLGPVDQPPHRPPELPDDLTDLNDPQVTNLMVEFTRWADYSAMQLAMAEIDEEAAEEMLRTARAIGLIKAMPSAEALRRKEESMTSAKAQVEQTDEVSALRQNRLNAYALRKMLLPRHEAFVRDANVLSRELTRRTDRVGSERRSSWLGGSRG